MYFWLTSRHRVQNHTKIKLILKRFVLKRFLKPLELCPKLVVLCSFLQKTSRLRVLGDNIGPGFLAVVRFGSSPTASPLSCQQVVSLSQSSCTSMVELTDGRGVRGWGRRQIQRRRGSLALYK